METLFEVGEVAGLFSDAFVVEEGRLRFLSILGLETAVRELQARLSLPTGDPRRVHQLTVGDTVIETTETKGWRQFSGRVKTRLFGDLVQLFIYDPLTVEPDRARGRALLLERAAAPNDDRLWALLCEVCPYPLLDHWQGAVLTAFRELEWIRPVAGEGVQGCWIDLADDTRVGASLQRLIRADVLGRDPADGMPALPDLSDLHAEASPASDAIEEEPLAGFERIHRYTRAEAIADGFLVDVSATNEAREAGFVWPVAMTRTVWEDCVEWSDEDSRRQTDQDETGRLWDVLNMARFAIRRSGDGGRELLYTISRVPRGGRGVRPREVSLKLVSGPGDNGEPVITILMPDED
ncbi:DUF6573 family protein [Endothiovibrio diazotrophicus]